MRNIFLGAVLAALSFTFSYAAPFADNVQVKGTLTDLETKSWVAWQGHDGKYFDGFLSDDHVEVGFAGPVGKKSVVAGIAGGACTVASYKVGEMQYSRIAEDTAVLVYRAEQDTKCGGVAVPSPVWATSVFVKRNGRWQNFLYQHSTAAPAG
jgi:hypothetical protein